MSASSFSALLICVRSSVPLSSRALDVETEVLACADDPCQRCVSPPVRIAPVLIDTLVCDRPETGPNRNCNLAVAGWDDSGETPRRYLTSYPIAEYQNGDILLHATFTL